jgi:small GTP-binding protein
MSEDVTLKVIILGASTVGKTSIFLRYFNNEFSHGTLTTLGVDFKTKFFKFENKKLKINYIDTAGQEKFKSISENYLKGTDGVILVFDLTNKETLDLVNYWADCIKKNNRDNIGMILFGNKSDLENDRDVTYEEGKNLADKLGCQYYEGSAMNGDNVEFVMNEIAKISYNEWKKTAENRMSIRLSSAASIEVEKIITKKKFCCKGK